MHDPGGRSALAWALDRSTRGPSFLAIAPPDRPSQPMGGQEPPAGPGNGLRRMGRLDAGMTLQYDGTLSGSGGAASASDQSAVAWFRRAHASHDGRTIGIPTTATWQR